MTEIEKYRGKKRFSKLAAVNAIFAKWRNNITEHTLFVKPLIVRPLVFLIGSQSADHACLAGNVCCCKLFEQNITLWKSLRIEQYKIQEISKYKTDQPLRTLSYTYYT